MDYIIRPAKQEDLEGINLIYNQAVEEKFCTAHLEALDIEDRRKWFDSHSPNRFPIYVVDHQGKVLGWLSLGPYREDRQALEHVAEISYYVERDCRGIGVGGALMEYAIRIAPKYGFTVLIAILLGENLKSVSFLEKHGFERWGVMPEIARIGQVLSDHVYYGLKIKE